MAFNWQQPDLSDPRQAWEQEIAQLGASMPQGRGEHGEATTATIQWNQSPQGQRYNQLVQLGVQNGWAPKDGGMSWGLKDAFLNPATLAAVGGGMMAGAGVGGASAGGLPTTLGGGVTTVGAGGGIASSGLGGSSGTVGTMFGGAGSTGTGLAGAGGSLGAGGLSTAVGAGAGAGSLGYVMPGAASAAASTGANPAANSGGFGSFMDSIFGAGKGAGAANALLPILGQAGLDAWAADRQRQQTNTAAERADPFASQRPQYQQQLSKLQNDPSSFANNPAYKFATGQGQQALERSNVAKGMLGSGNYGLDLVKYGQDSAFTGLNQEKSFLAGLAGANIGSPGMAGQITNNSPSIAQTYQGLSQLGTLGGTLQSGWNNRNQTPYNSGNNAGAIV